MVTIASTYALVRWLDDGRRWSRALVYALLAITVVWMHYLFALVLVPQALYAFIRLRRGETSVSARRLAAVARLMLAGIVPLASSSPRCGIDARPSRSRARGPSRRSRSVLLPPILVASLFLGSLFAGMRERVRVAPVHARSSTLVLLGTWLLFPVVTLFLVSTLTPVNFLSPRYFASVSPAIALLAGWAIASLQPASVRRLVAFALAILSVLAFGGLLKNGEDWRGTAAFERAHADPDTVVLLHPALVESAQLDWFSDPEKRSYLLSVESYYPMDGRVLPMPYVLDAEARAYLEGLVTAELAGEDRFLLVTRYPLVPFRDWLDGRLRSEGYTSRLIGTFGTIKVFEFSRTT